MLAASITFRFISLYRPVYPSKVSSRHLIQTHFVLYTQRAFYSNSHPSNNVKKPSLWERIKAELKHYWHGTKLFGSETALSSRLLYNHYIYSVPLSRREVVQVRRSKSDMIKLIPFSIFVIVPFLEFALPFFLKFFPDMLPSTFEPTSRSLLKRQTLLAYKQDKAFEITQKLMKGNDGVTITDFKDLRKEREMNELLGHFTSLYSSHPSMIKSTVSNENLVKLWRSFPEETFNLKRLSYSELLLLCQFIGVRNLFLYKTSVFLSNQLNDTLSRLQQDSLMIHKEGGSLSLTVNELKYACLERGITINEDDHNEMGVEKMKADLDQWLHLSLVEATPVLFLLLHRVFLLSSSLDKLT